jgi:hypothetical protein
MLPAASAGGLRMLLLCGRLPDPGVTTVTADVTFTLFMKQYGS